MAGGTKTKAVPAPGGGWILNGSKTFTTHGSVGDLTIVVSPSPTLLSRRRGFSAFAIETGTPGFRKEKKENKMGLRASDTAEVIMEDAPFPPKRWSAFAAKGFVDAMKILDGGRISIRGAGARDGSRRLRSRIGLLEARINSASDRGVPGVQHMLARDGGHASTQRRFWMYRRVDKDQCGFVGAASHPERQRRDRDRRHPGSSSRRRNLRRECRPSLRRERRNPP